MPSRIEDYALIGDLQTCALVARNGSIDWMCVPRFDSPAAFAALLGGPEHGRWTIAPRSEPRAIRRRYRGDSLILETEFETEEGRVRVIDFMPIRTTVVDLVRIVEGIEGCVPMRAELEIRFDYGSIIPWVRSIPGGIRAIAGPDTIYYRADVPLRGQELSTVAEFDVTPGHASRSISHGPARTARRRNAWTRGRGSNRPRPSGANGRRTAAMTGRGAMRSCGHSSRSRR